MPGVLIPDSSDGFADKRPVGTNGTVRTRLRRSFFEASPVYPILDAGWFGDRDPGPVLRAFAREGIRIVQFRAKGVPTGAFLRWVSAGVRGGRGSGIRVVVNDRADVALLSGADGVHLGQTDLSAGAARRLLGTDAIIGRSTHSPDELRKARREPADYLAVGPVFETATKTDSAPVVSLAGVAEARRMFDGPLVAIGGITTRSITSVLEAGADAAAVVSAVSGTSPREIADKARVLVAAASAAKRPGTDAYADNP